jgi:hypothetical protein
MEATMGKVNGEMCSTNFNNKERLNGKEKMTAGEGR